METLRTATLPKVSDGLLAIMIDDALARATADISDRPGVKTARKVVIELQIAPVDSGEDVVSVNNIAFTVDVKIPKSKLVRQMAYSQKRNSLNFEPDTNSTRNAPGQQRFPEVDADDAARAAEAAAAADDDGEDSGE